MRVCFSMGERSLRMSSFHNSGDVGNQTGNQNFYGNVNFIANSASNKSRVRNSNDANADSHNELDKAVLESLAFPDMFDRKNNVETHLRHTCEWILNVREYQSWKDSSSGLLWIKGNPGAGKSTLMLHLYRTASLGYNNSGFLQLEFFFNARGESLQHTPLGLLRSLLCQIFQKDINTRPILRNAFQERDSSFGQQKRTWKWQLQELKSLFSDIVLTSARNQQITIFIDALDEAGESDAEEIASYLYTIDKRVAESCTKAKICISCRHYPVLSRDQSVEIYVEKHNYGDIATYVREFLNLNTMPNLPSKTRAQVPDLQQYLIKEAKGIFQWVRLIVPLVRKRLADGVSLKRILQWLRQVPRGLEEVYKHILQNVIDTEYRTESLRLFQWVCLAIRPLSIEELRYAFVAHQITLTPRLSCEESEEFISTDEEMKPLIKSWSGGLLEIMKIGLQRTPRVQVIHQSVNDFFLAHGFALLTALAQHGDEHHLVTSVPSTACESIEEYHGNLYRYCLTYLAVEKSQEQSHQQSQSLYDETKEASAAETHWTRMLEEEMAFKGEPFESKSSKIEPRSCDVSFTQEPDPGISEEEESAESDCDDDNDDDNIFERRNPWQMPYWVLTEKFPLISYAASRVIEHAKKAGNCRVKSIAMEIELLHEVFYDWPATWSPLKRDDVPFCAGWTALHVAALADLTDLAQHIVKSGTDIDIADQAGFTALEIGAEKGHLAVVTLLLSAGALRIDNALIFASEEGHQDVVRLLIKHGANVNAHLGKSGDCALAMASNKGHENIVHILITAGADVNTQTGDHGTALLAATLEDHTDIVRLLIRNGADVNIRTPYGRPLSVASWRGHQATIKVLIEAGAAVNALDDWDHTALSQAVSSQRRIEIVQLLIEAGADVNAQADTYGSILWLASSRGYEKTVRLLIEVGANVNAQMKESGTALWAASRQGREAAVQVLIEAGADVNAQTEEEGTTILAGASSRGHREVVRLLIAAGVDVNAQSRPYGTALQAAREMGYKSIAEILVEAGAIEKSSSEDSQPEQLVTLKIG